MKILSAAILSATLLLCLSVPSVAAAEEPSSPPPPKMMVYYLALLYKGGNWTAEDTPAVRQLQEQHMANIRRLAESGKLILAGPFEEDSDLRGLFLLKAASKQEAQELCEGDPAVKAGRLRAEIHPWWGPEGDPGGRRRPSVKELFGETP